MSDRFDELWLDFLEGELDGCGLAELDRMLASDPKLLKRAGDAYEEHRLLGLVMQESAEEFEGFVADTLHGVRADSEKYSSTIIDRQRQDIAARQFDSIARKRWQGSAIIAAVSVAICVIGLWALWQSTRRPPREPPAPALVDRGGQYLATLVRDENCQWNSQTQQMLKEGSRLQAGTLRLSSGVALVRFDAGARVVLKGPAEFALESADSALLVSGEVIVRADDEAAGFALRTSVSDFVDWGTEFTVSVEPSGAAEIHVLEGAVQCQQPGRADDELQFIEQGQAFRIEGENVRQAVAIPLEKKRFESFLQRTSGRREKGRPQVYEGFEYATPEVFRPDGGFGWSGGWHGRAFENSEPVSLIRPDSLEAPGRLSTSRGGLLELPAKPIYVYKRRLATPLKLAADGIEYISFLVRKTTSAADGDEHAFRLMWISSADASLNAGFGVRPKGFPFIYSRGGGHSIADSPIQAGKSYLFVGKVVTASDATDQLFLKVIGPGDLLDAREPETWSVVGRPTDLHQSLDSIAVAFNVSGGFQIDEIRIGSTWEAVTPEDE